MNRSIKKLLALFCMMALCFNLTACDTINGFFGVDEDSDKSDEKKEETVAQSETETEKEKEEAEGGDTFQETTVVDNDKVCIKVTSVDHAHPSGFSFETYYENKSDDTNYRFLLKDSLVDGVSCSFDSDYVNLPSGVSTTNTYTVDDEFYDQQVGSYTDIQLTFAVTDEQGYDRIIDDVTTHIYPLGRNNASVYNRPNSSSDRVLIDNQYMTIIAFNENTEKELDYEVFTADLYCVNKTNGELYAYFGDLTINGTLLDLSINGCYEATYGTPGLEPNSKFFDKLEICTRGYSYKFDAPDLQSIEATFKIRLNSEIVTTETVKFNP